MATRETANEEIRSELHWVKWAGTLQQDDNITWTAEQRLRVRIFKILLGFGGITLALLVLQGVIISPDLPLADSLNILIFALLYIGVSYQPAKVRQYAWLAIVTMWINVFDGILPLNQELISPTHILMPLLVLFGGWMGSRSMTLFSLTGTFLVYLVSAKIFWPISDVEIHLLSNLFLLSAVSGFASMLILHNHRETATLLREQAGSLSEELDINLRLNAVMFHDLSNPLLALNGMLEMATTNKSISPDDISGMQRLAHRMGAIIRSVREFNTQEAPGSTRYPSVPVNVLVSNLEEGLAFAMKQKDLSLELTEGGHLEVRAPKNILVNSVLSNLLTNAIKFSPRASKIEIRALDVNHETRIEIFDAGAGFPDDVLFSRNGKGYGPRAGTEGEMGSGFGLRILALYMDRLHGRLELCNRPGGAGTAVVLPSKT